MPINGLNRNLVRLKQSQSKKFHSSTWQLPMLRQKQSKKAKKLEVLVYNRTSLQVKLAFLQTLKD